MIDLDFSAARTGARVSSCCSEYIALPRIRGWNQVLLVLVLLGVRTALALAPERRAHTL